MNTRTHNNNRLSRQLMGLAAKFAERLLARAVLKHNSLNAISA